MAHEHILVSGIYYYQNSDCLEDAGLAFRADTGYDDYHGPDSMCIFHVIYDQYQHFN
jgi:hypothetical protein